MEDPAYEAALRKRLEKLKEELQKGRLRIPPPFMEELKRSLAAVRYGGDGQIDLSTVDGRVRSLALAVSVMHERQALKESVSLKDIQHAYFEFIGDVFDRHYKTMLERHLNPGEGAHVMASDPAFVKIITSLLPDWIPALTEFWSRALEPAHVHQEDAKGVKAIFGGDLFPSPASNIASALGLYIDTIVLPEPFLRTVPLFERATPERRAFFFAKHGLNILQYKSLALADLDPPIVVVLPDRSLFDEAEQEVLGAVATGDALKHASAMFGRQFSSIRELQDFVAPLGTVSEALAQVRSPDRMLFDVDWSGTPDELLKQALAAQGEDRLVAQHPGQYLGMLGVGRMAQINDLLLRSQRLRGTPLIDAPTSWQYFRWKLEYDAHAKEAECVGLTNLHIVRGLQAAGASDVEWLGNVPPDALIEVRSQGALGEIRELLGRGIEEIATARPSNFYRTADQVVANIQGALDDYTRQLKELSSKKWRFAGSDIGSWLVAGSAAVAAAATGNSMYALLALAADQVLDLPKLKTLGPKFVALREESRALDRSPVGLLFRAKRSTRS